MAGHAAGIGHDRGGAAHQRDPVGRGHMGDEDVALPKAVGVVDRGDDACTPAGRPRRRPEAAQQDRAAAAPGIRRGAPDRRDRARLDHPQSAVGVEAPLGVLRAAVMALDRQSGPAQQQNLLVVEHRGQRLAVIEAAAHRAAVRERLDRHLLDVHLAHEDRQGGFVDDVPIGRDAPGHDRLAQAEGALDHEVVLVGAGGVDGEHDPGPGGGDLALDDHRDVLVGLPESALGAIEDGAGAEHRCPAGADRVQHRVGAADVEEGLVHAGERGRRTVLGRRGGADGHRILIAEAEVGQGLTDRIPQPFRNGRPGHDLTCAHRGRLERGGVVDVDGAEQLVEAAAHPGLLAELRIRRCPDDETGRNGHAGVHQLPEVGALTAGVARIAAAQPVQ